MVGRNNVPAHLEADRMNQSVASKLGTVWDANKISVAEQDFHHTFVTYDDSDNIVAKYPIISFELLDHLVCMML